MGAVEARKEATRGLEPSCEQFYQYLVCRAPLPSSGFRLGHPSLSHFGPRTIGDYKPYVHYFCDSYPSFSLSNPFYLVDVPVNHKLSFPYKFFVCY